LDWIPFVAKTPKSDVVKCQQGCCNELGSGNGGMMLNANKGVVLIIGQRKHGF